MTDRLQSKLAIVSKELSSKLSTEIKVNMQQKITIQQYLHKESREDSKKVLINKIGKKLRNIP